MAQITSLLKLPAISALILHQARQIKREEGFYSGSFILYWHLNVFSPFLICSVRVTLPHHLTCFPLTHGFVLSLRMCSIELLTADF